MSFKPSIVKPREAQHPSLDEAENEAFSKMSRFGEVRDSAAIKRAEEAEARRAALVASVEALVSRPGSGALLSIKPAPLDFVLPGLVAGTAAALISPGGTGKSYLGLQLALLVAAGFDSFEDSPRQGSGGHWNGLPGLLGLMEWRGLKTGKVAYVSLEDNTAMLANRLHSVGAKFGLGGGTKEARDTLAKIDASFSLIDATGNVADILRDPAWREWFAEQCATNRLVVLDTLRLSHQADENKSGEMAELMASLSAWSARGGAAILFLHHANKDSMREGTGDSQAAARGSSVIVDNARGAFYLQRMTVDEAASLADRKLSSEPIGDDRRRFYVKFGVSKANACAPWPPIWLRVDEGGKLTRADIDRPGQAVAQKKAKGNSYE